MLTDTERREVARRLRKAIGLTEFAEALGFNWTDDSDWGWKDVSDFVADLIEPSCDREALLRLSDEIYDTSCDNHGELTVDLIDIWGWAQAICEALGVES